MYQITIKKGKKGFSLIEMYAVMVMLVLVLGVLVYTFLAGQLIFNNEKNTSDAYIEATKGVDLMSGEIKSGRLATSISPTSFTFWETDLNADSTPEANELVTFSWDGSPEGNLLRTFNGASTTISRYVMNLNFTYDTSEASNVNAITIDLTNGVGSQLFTVESTAELRNKW